MHVWLYSQLATPSRTDFSKNVRLLKKAEFKSLFADSKKANLPFMLALYKPNQDPLARLGVIVGKKVAALAVDRNTIKRIVRESFRLHQTQLSGFNILVIARSQCNQLDKFKLRVCIDSLWKKLLLQRERR